MSDRIERAPRPEDVSPQPNAVASSPQRSISPLLTAHSAVELPTAPVLHELRRVADPNLLIEGRKRALESFSQHVSTNPDLLDGDFDSIKPELQRALTPQGEVEDYRIVASDLAVVLATSLKGRAMLCQIVSNPTDLIAQSSTMSISPADPSRLLTDKDELIKKMELLTAVLPALALPGFESRDILRLTDQLENGDRALCHSLCRVLLEAPSAMGNNSEDQKEEIRRSILNCLLGTEDLSHRELDSAVSFLAPTLTEKDIDQITFDFERGSIAATGLLLNLYAGAEALQGEFDDSLKVVMQSGKTTTDQLAIIQSHDEFLSAASPQLKSWLTSKIEQAGDQLSYGVNPIRIVRRYFERSVLKRDFTEQGEMRVVGALKTVYMISKANPAIQKMPEKSLQKLASSISPAVSGWASLLLGEGAPEFHQFLIEAARAQGNRYPDDLRDVVAALEKKLAEEREDRLVRL